MTTAQREALTDLLYHTFLDMRGMFYATGYTEEQLRTYIHNVGDALHNVPHWLESGVVSKEDFDWVMTQKKKNYRLEEVIP